MRSAAKRGQARKSNSPNANTNLIAHGAFGGVVALTVGERKEARLKQARRSAEKSRRAVTTGGSGGLREFLRADALRRRLGGEKANVKIAHGEVKAVDVVKQKAPIIPPDVRPARGTGMVDRAKTVFKSLRRRRGE